METAEIVNKTYTTTLKLSIRRKNLNGGLPGDDPTTQNLKIGSSLSGKGPLSGLTLEEEKKYLPNIINIDPNDIKFRTEVRDYWNNISERVPHDIDSTDPLLPGRPISFAVTFNSEALKNAFEEAVSFEQKAEISKKGLVDPVDLPDYILFRYCLVYGRVANDVKYIHKSAKIDFYLYSREQKDKIAYSKFKLTTQARNLFTTIMSEESKVNAILRLFDRNPDDIVLYPSLEHKHMELDTLISEKPSTFLQYANDKELAMKDFILKATEKGIIFNPPNTEMYYLGAEKEVLLGNDLMSAVHFLKSKEERNQAIKDTIKSQLVAQ